MSKLVIRSSTEILHHLNAQKKSDLTVPAYCKRHRIALSSFWYWRKRYKKEISGRKNKNSKKRPSIIKVAELAPACSRTPVSVSVGCAKVDILPGCDSETVSTVFSALLDAHAKQQDK